MAVIAAVRASLAQLGPGLYVVACSGGADSMALADAAIEVAGAANVVVATIDHAMADGSARRAADVAAWAAGRGAAAIVRRWQRSDLPRRPSEAAARDARYALLAAIADEVGACAVLVAHTARDQAETVMMRILRGTGPAGLAGIPSRRERFVRPLLGLPRSAIDAHVGARGLPTWHDPMNDDRTVTRVRVRRDILPRLRAENPSLDDALVRLAASAAEWTEVIDALAARHALPIDCVALAREPAAVRKRAITRVFDGLDAAHVDAIDALVTAPSRGTVGLDIPGGRVERRYDQLYSGSAVALTSEAPPLTDRQVLRTWQPGDRIRLAGGTRKLSDVYIDLKIPRAMRRAARVIIEAGEIVWAEHVGPRRTGGNF